ncbi:hypothetical protein ARMGADRAFT_925007, partial [Armillaria gallica]
LSCYLHPLCCTRCMIESHCHLPFHCVEKWNGHYFEKTSLHNLDYVFCLGHDGHPCPNQLSTVFCRVIVIDINGYHDVNIMFCFCCDWETNEAKQLFHHLLFPVTLVHPETVFTTEVLDQFDIHNCTSTKSVESFCSALQKLTNAGQPNEVSDSYRTFMQASHIHHHLQAVRRSGQAHGIDNYIMHWLKASIAIHCPACPELG